MVWWAYMAMPRAARAPHSSKVPESCLHCGSHVLTRRGTRKKKLEIVQLWRCASCKRTFTPGPQAIRNKTYPLRTVIDALATYSLGYSLEDTAARVKSKSGRQIGAATVAGWLAQHRDLMSYLRLRDRGRHLFPAAQTIRSIKLYHRQITGMRSIGRSSSTCGTENWMTGGVATRASRPSPIFSKPCRSSARMISFARRIVVVHRKRSPRLRMSFA
jgi:transposase-like protein